MTVNMDKQLNNIGLNLLLLLKYARKTQQDLADEIGKSRQAVSAWVNGTQLRSRSLIDLARIMSSWLGVRIKPNDFHGDNFAETLIAGLKDKRVEHDSSYVRPSLSVDEYIWKNRKSENLDEHDEAFLHNLYSRGVKLDRISEESIRKMLISFRENAKDQWISGSK